MRGQRTKLSTTIAPETSAYLEKMVRSGRASSLAEAVDAVVARSRQMDNRKRLSLATKRYFEEMEPAVLEAESQLAKELTQARAGIDFDEEL